ncbi:hypothetical protein OAG68_01475 [bacterium]|nr:hypothetical protein [bacterium]
MPRFIPENWSIDVDLLISVTVGVALIWLALTIFIYWRRSSTNLTPVDVPKANPDAQPDFLSVDKKKQKAALKRGDEYARQLAKANQENRDPSQPTPVRWLRKAAGYAALFLAMVLVATVAMGCIWPDSYVGELLSEYSAENRLADIIQSNPISLIVALLVILVKATQFLGMRSSIATE